MKINTLSATSGDAYENCPARFEAEYTGDRARSVTGDPAGIGIVCHSCLETWVKLKYHTTPLPNPIDVMHTIYDSAYYTVFSDKRHYNEGLALVQKWLARQDWSGREVISTEQRSSFPLKLADASTLPFVHVIDRLDKIKDKMPGHLEIEVVDYKTVSQPITPDDLHDKLQARAYAVAAQIMFPSAELIWVTFDLLRFNTSVSSAFGIDENRENYKYLRALAQRIIDDNKPKETLNPDCRWCVRKHECSQLRAHAAVGGALSFSDVDEAAANRFILENAKKGIEGQLTELDAYIMAEMERQELLSFNTPEYSVEITADKRRSVDSGLAADIIGYKLMTNYGQLRMGDIDDLLKGDELDASQKEALKGLIRYNIGKPGVKVKKKK